MFFGVKGCFLFLFCVIEVQQKATPDFSPFKKLFPQLSCY